VTFKYNASDPSLQTCSLIINGSVNQTDNSPSNGVNSFNAFLSNGDYSWRVNCTDSYGNEGASQAFQLSVKVYAPSVTVAVQPSITLNAGSTKMVECNVTVQDLNGASDIAGVNATFYYHLNQSSDPDDADVHYSTACSESGAGSYSKNYTCSFNVYYHALNGTWNCNATALDNQSLTGSAVNSTTIQPLYAINTSTDFIDYGSAAVNEESLEVEVNISNIGNMPVKVSVWGFGGSSPATGSGLAMICQGNNISVSNEKYSETSTPYQSKNALSSTPQLLTQLIPKKESSSNTPLIPSYWQVKGPVLDPPVSGVCNGSVVFQAEQP